MGRSKKSDNDNVEPKNTGPITVEDAPSEDDIFSQFFGDGSENVVVEIYRVEPEFLEGANISGFVERLRPGDNIESVRLRLGGGKYKLMQKIRGKIKRQGYFRISGLPRMPVPSEIPGVPLADAPSSTPVPDGVSYKGIPVSGSNADFISLVERIQMLKTIFPEKPDINETLLTVALARNDGGGNLDNVLGQAEKLGQLVEHLGGGQQTGSNLVDLGIKAIDGFTRYLQTAEAAQRNKIIDHIKKPAAVGAGAGKPVGILPEKTPERETENMPAEDELSEKAIAKKAAGLIVVGFIQEPVQKIADTVELLKFEMPAFDDSALAKIRNNKQMLYLLARNALVSTIEADAETGKEFDVYFNQVFDDFVGSADTTQNI